jgi:hypothetical protein
VTRLQAVIADDQLTPVLGRIELDLLTTSVQPEFRRRGDAGPHDVRSRNTRESSEGCASNASRRARPGDHPRATLAALITIAGIWAVAVGVMRELDRADQRHVSSTQQESPAQAGLSVRV